MDETKTAPDSVMARLVKIDGKLPRLWKTTLVAIAMLVAMYFMAPLLMGVIQHKVTLQVIAFVLGYFADRAIFHYARPHALLEAYAAKVDSFTATRDLFNAEAIAHLKMLRRSFDIACIRRAIIVAASIIGIACGA
jgi:hypothetical protein